MSPQRLAIIGHPISHSLSPVFHTSALAISSLSGTYTPLDIRPDELEEAARGRLVTDFDGFNVTIPHKVSILPFLTTVSDEARVVGAVNTVVVRNGMLEGHNTDSIGIERSLRPFEADIKGQVVTIIGSGGAARAAMAVLLKSFKPSETWIAGRNEETAEALREAAPEASRAGIRIVTTPEDQRRAASRSRLIIQATPLGMHPRTEERPLPHMRSFSREQIVFDLIYRPRETRFLREARIAGARTVDGLEMFLQQAAAAFALWTGKRVHIDELRPILEDTLNAS